MADEPDPGCACLGCLLFIIVVLMLLVIIKALWLMLIRG